MNHIAHCVLSGNNPDILIGNLLTDWLKPAQKKVLNPKYSLGLALHFCIDDFTDAHPEVKKANRLISDFAGKYAPVVTDIFFDYLLCENWHLYHSELKVSPSYGFFFQSVYKIINDDLKNIPEAISPRLVSMIKAEWLISYTSEEGLENVFKMLKKRTHFENNLDKIVPTLFKLKPDLESHFQVFFPSLMNEVNTFFTSNQ